ncbi:MAG: hypothetical protein NTZ46_00725 [Verrucomicrobia bacterium]|nr:hypothetical protein [Verrucomicrobiota bacterium]
MSWFRRLQTPIAACLVLGALNLLARATEPAEIFYYLAVPSCPGPGECVSVACIQLDGTGAPVDAKSKDGKPFFSIWYSGCWQPKPTKSFPRWSLPEREGELPVPLLGFFTELEKLRAASARPIILQPLFKPPFSMRWEHVAHLNVVASASDVSAESRSKALLASFHDPQGTDPAKSLSSSLGLLGMKPHRLRYWPEYNVFLIEADARLKETIEILFLPLE